MFWGRVLLFTASDLVLQADAILVGWLAQTPRTGTTLQFADGVGHVWIAPGCSSLANLSLAILCWVLFSQWRGLRWSPAGTGWCLCACLAVLGINVTRISLMVLDRNLVDIVHGPTGSAVTSWLMIAVTVGICAFGTRHGRSVHA
jgi:hypothetical protein